MYWFSDLLYVGFSSGTLRVFSIGEKNLIERFVLDVHDFGINCMHAAADSSGEVFIATGGDD
jgi:hypothetical protein